MRKFFFAFSFALAGLYIVSYFFFPIFLWTLILSVPVIGLGIKDILQTRHALRRNFPVIGHFRYLLESIRPEINQYFIESNKDGRPFSREQRSLVYQRAKKELDSLPFGTQEDVYQVGYEWLAHSMAPVHVDTDSLKVWVGGKHCKQPYNASVLNISAMSFGSLSPNAIMALNGGAKDGSFAHNTGEGGLSPYHLKNGGDIIWQIGTGYFGARDEKGKFSPTRFQANALRPEVKMIELKLSQGAKPGHGGILPKEKLTREIAEIRGVPMGEDVLSPPGHTAFSNPIELVHFIQKLRDLSEGKPIGIKLCLGKRWEFIALCKAMVETGITPDYIAVDGGEGGTGAAPLEFSNRVGFPAIEGQIFVHNALVGFDLRSDIKIIAIGKVTSAFDMIKKFALGADLTYAARSFMLALGCIQALRCNSNTCPTGVATQDPSLMKGLVVGDKRTRVHNFHSETLKSLAHLMGALGLHNLSEVRPHLVLRRGSAERVMSYADLFEFIPRGSLLSQNIPESFKEFMNQASSKSFRKAA
jgi:glutamate synthase domain-containing protein 2